MLRTHQSVDVKLLDTFSWQNGRLTFFDFSRQESHQTHSITQSHPGQIACFDHKKPKRSCKPQRYWLL